MREITAEQAVLGYGYRYAIVGHGADGEYVYSLYASEDEARRISNDLNARYGEGSYEPARIAVGGGESS